MSSRIVLPFSIKELEKQQEIARKIAPKFVALNKLLKNRFTSVNLGYLGDRSYRPIVGYILYGNPLDKLTIEDITTIEKSKSQMSKMFDSLFERHQLLHGNLKIYNLWVKKLGMLQYYFDGLVLNDNNYATNIRRIITDEIYLKETRK